MLGDTEALKLMLPKVKNINELSAGITLLALAAHSGNLEAVKLLLKDGAKANVHMPDGTVAFDHAGSQAIRNLLRARPGKPER
jgi:ankyrin repeat protein